MTDISALAGTASVDRNPSNGFASMTSEDFMKIIFTELAYQDPLSPTDSTAMLQQLDSIRSIEADLRLNEDLKALVSQNQLAAASSMVGKFIGGMAGDFGRVAGYVVSVIKEGDSVNMELDTGFVVPFESVETIVDPSIFENLGDSADETSTEGTGDESGAAGAGNDDSADETGADDGGTSDGTGTDSGTGGDAGTSGEGGEEPG